jgi:RyR domain
LVVSFNAGRGRSEIVTMSSKLPNNYAPKPISTEGINIHEDLTDLLEALAKNAHDMWAKQRLADGWTWGESRCDERKEHPGLIDYDELTEEEKEYDRLLVKTTLCAIIALGYRLSKTPDVGEAAEAPH